MHFLLLVFTLSSPSLRAASARSESGPETTNTGENKGRKTSNEKRCHGHQYIATAHTTDSDVAAGRVTKWERRCNDHADTFAKAGADLDAEARPDDGHRDRHRSRSPRRHRRGGTSSSAGRLLSSHGTESANPGPCACCGRDAGQPSWRVTNNQELQHLSPARGPAGLRLVHDALRRRPSGAHRSHDLRDLRSCVPRRACRVASRLAGHAVHCRRARLTDRARWARRSALFWR